MMQGSVANTVQAKWDGVDLAALLSIEPMTSGRYQSRYCEDNRNGRVFGGQLLGQALAAAQTTVDAGRIPTALRVLFMQGALTDQPIEYQIETLQEGKRFSSRRVVARQGERLLTDAQLSFQLPGDGFTHALPPYQAAPDPENVLSMRELSASSDPRFAGVDWAAFEKPCLELRVVSPAQHLITTSTTPAMAFWLRLRQALPDDAPTHAAALAYLSDYWINSAAITHHIAVRQAHATLYVASLNHALWFHHACRADEWLLFSTESPAAQQGRALTMGRIYNRRGLLIASVAQECLLAKR